jgi:hypothetical protein
MPQFLAELGVIRERTSDARALRALESIDALARRCRDEVHLYLKFRGD